MKLQRMTIEDGRKQTFMTIPLALRPTDTSHLPSGSSEAEKMYNYQSSQDEPIQTVVAYCLRKTTLVAPLGRFLILTGTPSFLLTTDGEKVLEVEQNVYLLNDTHYSIYPPPQEDKSVSYVIAKGVLEELISGVYEYSYNSQRTDEGNYTFPLRYTVENLQDPREDLMWSKLPSPFKCLNCVIE